MPNFEQFPNEYNEFSDEDSNPYERDGEWEDRSKTGIDVCGIFAILLAIVGWGVIFLGIPLLAVFGVGIFVMLAGSRVCLLGVIFSPFSNIRSRAILLLVLNGVGGIPAFFILMAQVLNYLFPV